jgi:predicted permease
MESLVQDLRYAARKLIHSPGFTVVAVLTLSLGVGATTAIFSVVNGVLLRPLPYPEPDRLVAVSELTRDGEEIPVAGANFQDWRSTSRSFEGLAVHAAGAATVLGGADPIRPEVASVSADFFRVLGTQPLLGRTFSPEEAAPGGPPVLVVSHDFWRNQLGGTRSLAARALQVYGTTYQVIGVMPPGFRFPGETGVWIPETLKDPGARNAHNWSVVGRVREGVGLDLARTELDGVQRQLKSQFGDEVDGYGVKVVSLQEALVGSAQGPLLLLLSAAALVLLIACANLASTLLARGTARRQEVAVRSALGASRHRLVRQLLTEGMLLAGLGAIGGLVVAVLALRALTVLAPGVAIPRVEEVGVDGWMLACALLASLAAALLFSLLPALRTSSTEMGRDLTGTRGVAGGRGVTWNLLVGAEVALALLLLAGAGLLIRSFWEVTRVNTGFSSEGVLTIDLALPETSYPDDPAVAAFHQSFLAELESIPGVEAAGIVNLLPLGGANINGGFEIEGRGEGSGYADYRAASRDYFGAMRIPLRRGRLFDERDAAGAPDAVVINQTLADRYWPGEDPLGKRIRNLSNDSWVYGEDRWLTVVGVVGDVRHGGPAAEPSPEVYVNYAQRPFRARYTTAVVRSGLPSATLVPIVRSRLKERFGGTVPAEFQTMDAHVARAVGDRRFTMVVLGAFAAVALVLAAVGIYGVISYRVSQRTREIGVRIALGADPRQVRGMIVRNSMMMVGGGILAGAVCALLLTRVIRSFLFGVDATDPGTLAGVLLLLTGAALLACYLPARRATRVDPMVALRAE